METLFVDFVYRKVLLPISTSSMYTFQTPHKWVLLFSCNQAALDLIRFTDHLADTPYICSPFTRLVSLKPQ